MNTLPVQEMVSRVAQAHPEAIAVVQGTRRLSYRTLMRRAESLAVRLQGLGVSRGDRVVLATTRSPEMVVGMLAVLQAGAAYIPVDPGYPAERLEFLIGDAGARLVLTEPEVRSGLPGLDCPATDIPHDEDGGEERPVPVPTDGSDLAYCIYTSGSTGLPKGVEIPHEGLSNLVAWHRETYGLTSADRTTQIAGTAFDASVWEIWPTLTTGAELHLAVEGHSSAAELVEWLTGAGITVSFLPTPLAELVIAEEWPTGTRLRYLLTGGDRLHRHPPAGLPFTLVNHYGPTECTVVATAGEVPAGAEDREPSIGWPIRGIKVRLLDDQGSDVPDGTEGELFLSGTGLARGYLNRPELTAERFVTLRPDGCRYYRTGDLAVRNPDGSLRFVGRTDGQVKLRGFRIELGEIESTLCAHPQVTGAAAALREDVPGDPRLAAYPVFRPGASLSAAELRSWLAERLPGHLVPTSFTALDALPLTRNGKVDRSALPAPAQDRDALAGAYVAPAEGVETELAQLWEEVLGVDRVGALDDFFVLGGNSLSAVRVAGRLRERHAVELPLIAVFAEPTVRGLAGAVAAAPRRDFERPGPRTRDRSGLLPLSPSQRRMWLMNGLDDSGTTYNVPLAFELRGPLDEEALRQTLRAVVERHEALRTGFVVEAGTLLQVVGAVPEIDLPVVEVGNDEEQLRCAERIARHRFDLTTGPLIRFDLLRRGDQRHVLLAVVHHIAFDGWSLGVFSRDLADCYEAILAGRAPAPPLAVQPADIAEQLQRAADEASEGPHAEYWRSTLKGAPQDLGLPTDFVRPSRPTNLGGRETIDIGSETLDSLRALCRAEGVTLFMALAALCQAYLSRITGNEDVVIGSPVAGRNAPGTEPLVGCFINTLPLRTDLTGEPGFRDLLHRVRSVVLGAFEHQDTPFERIVELAAAGRSADQNPVYQVVFALEDAHRAEFDLGGLSATVTELDAGTSRADLSFSATPYRNGLRLTAEYRSDLFAPATVRRTLGTLRTLLGGVLAEPDRPFTLLPLLGPDEYRDQVHTWNDTARPFEDGATVHELVERRVDADPDAVAVVFEDRAALTYGELDGRANALAHRLRALGVGRETRVGLCLERSPELVVAVLAVLKAGGAYVPLDPAYPADRLAFMLADSAAPVVVTQSAVRKRLPQTSAAVVQLDTDPVGDGMPTTRPAPVSGPEGLAYVIYTSGSTGRPKGVLIEHRSVCNFMANVQQMFGLGPHDRILQFASLSFDVSAFEIFGALTSGARICLARQETLLSVRALSRFMTEQGITVMDMPPAVMKLLPGQEFPALRIAFVGGEAFSGGLVDDWSVPGRRFINGYGPTEGTVTVIAEECGPGAYEGSPPIGRPMGNMRAYVLDRRQQLLPTGIPGELWIGGAGLARGYLGRPELTEERFLADPFVPDENARIYRTGDLVRLLPDGRLDFLGRVDDQVKLRGFRIELGEVEAVLTEHPGIFAAAVLLRQDNPGHPRLVGYAVPADEALTAAELRAHLADRLPAHMVPDAFVLLESLPLSPSGKIDRRSLPAPAAADLTAARAIVQPRNRRERTLAELWCELLHVPELGVHDNFFELGGNSIAAVQLVWNIDTSFGVEIPLREVFDHPTVAALTPRIEAAMLAAHAARTSSAVDPKGSAR
ncbi:non-ribosomal peptide synthetase [Streptomyces sp. B1I3]|uniref:non-ribosomal peptide synthetase n=1 Tax=Streptomyces sp. B1I3 TaxID=3042264 RepID=UPI00278B2173|nr:non-ribosomal peptide synthetase [Streptomyces sp. B1I3]MDQ0791667.1 amino acid adenylation domain-containing protein [Streptomyces sp. B1I3]